MKRLLWLGCFSVAVCAAAALTQGRAVAAPTCQMNAGLSIAFGNFDVYSGAVSSSGTISGSCKKAPGGGNITITITINGGNHLQGSGNRAMACTTCSGIYASDLLQYQLYTDAPHSTIWVANTTSVTTTCTGCTGNTFTAFAPVTIYAGIFSSVAGGINDSAVGTYSDTITVTLNY